jgi:hypothetical protein
LMQQQQYQYQQHQQQYQPARPGWAVSREEKAQYDQIFSAWDLDHSGYISGKDIIHPAKVIWVTAPTCYLDIVLL